MLGAQNLKDPGAAMTFRAPLAALTASLLLAGCGASLPSLTTGSLFGGAATTEADGAQRVRGRA